MLALGDVVGGLSREASMHLGLREGLPVAQGGADAFVGMGETYFLHYNTGYRETYNLFGSFFVCVFCGRLRSS